MKVKRLLLPVLAAFILLAGCEREPAARVETYNFTVTPSQWLVNQGQTLPGSNNYLYCTIDLPAIDQQVFNYGTVQCYVWNVYDQIQNLGAWNLLPFVYPLELTTLDENGDPVTLIVPENLRFEWELGKITLIIQDLNGIDPAALTSSFSLKVCITRNI